MKKYCQKLAREIAKDTGVSLIKVHLTIAELQSIKEVSSCNVIIFDNGVAVEGILCRFSGYFPPAAAGREAATPALPLLPKSVRRRLILYAVIRPLQHFSL